MTEATSTTDLPIKIITGSDEYGSTLKDAMITHIRSLNIQVEDTGVSSYYSAGSQVGLLISTSPQILGLVCCGTGVGVAMFANKHPGVYAATCLTVEETLSTLDRSVTATSSHSPETAIEIFDAWIKTPFKSPCPASGSEPWSSEIADFLDNSIAEMAKIGKTTAENDNSNSCTICCLAKKREFKPVEIMPGGSMKIVRETPTSAIVRFVAGSVEPAHYHTFGHGLVVLKGRKSVWNLSKKERVDLGDGDYLFTPAGDVHRVKYYEDTEFFITWDGCWDIFLDEDIETAKQAIEEED